MSYYSSCAASSISCSLDAAGTGAGADAATAAASTGGGIRFAGGMFFGTGCIC